MNEGTNTVNGGHLRAFIERIERLESEKSAIAEDIKSVYAEASGTGFEAKIMRKIVANRKKPKEKLSEEEELLALYEAAIAQPDMFAGN